MFYAEIKAQISLCLVVSDALLLGAHFGSYLFRQERFDDIPDFNVVVVLDADTAFHAVGNFLRIVLEAP